MHALRAVLAALALAGSASAESITGVVRDEANNPVAGASVALAESHREVRTDEHGAFVLVEVAPGTYTLVISRVGYAPFTEPLAVPAPASIEIRLAASPFTLEAVTVTARRAPEPPLGGAQSTAVIGGEALERNQSVAVANAIEKLPGVRSLSTGLQIAKPVIRGLSGQRVLALENGHRLEDYSWSDEDGPSLDAAMASRIEVVRGPASLQYGSDALGGVVNAVAEALPDAIGQDPYHHVSFSGSFASNNAEIGTSVRYEAAKRGLGWRLVALGRHAASLHTPDGELEHTGFVAVNGEGAIGHRGQAGEIALRVARYGGEFKLLEANGPPPGEGEEEGEEEGPERKANDVRVQLDGNRTFGGWRVDAKSQFQAHNLIELSDEFTTEPAAREKKETEAFNLTLNTLSLDVTAVRPLGGAHLTVGASGTHQTNDTTGPIPLVPNATTDGAAAFGLVELGSGRVTVSGGARGETRHLTADATEGVLDAEDTRSFEALSSGVGVVFRPVETVALTGHFGQAWRAPNLFELYSDGPRIGDARYEVGDPGLDAERGLSFDVGVKTRERRLAGSVNAFSNTIDDYIYITPTGETISDLPVYRYTQADARLTGFEASVDLDIAAPLTLHGQIDGVRATNRTTDDPLPLTPPLRTLVGAEVHGRLGGERAFLEVDVERVEKQERLNPLDLQVGSYTLLGVEAGMWVHLSHHAFRLDLDAHNVTDESYRDFLSRYKAFALDPGRDVRLRVTTSL